ncbi:TIGR03364 family FAD-dependent oxidoreductase [soil metagenome]
MARVVVVGGGIVGTMHALFASRRGHEVVQVERNGQPRSASVRNLGLVWVSGRAPGDELEVALRARELWEEIGADVPGVGFDASGSLTLALDPAELTVLEQAAAQPDAGARGLHLLDPDEVRRRYPAVRGQVLGGLFCERDAQVEPRTTLGSLRVQLGVRGGYRFLAGRPAVGIDTGRVVDAPGEVHRGDLVVVCPGHDADPLGGDPLAGAPLRRCRLLLLQTAPLTEPLMTSVADADSLRYYPAYRHLPALAELPRQTPLAERWRAQLLMVQRASGALTVGDTHEYDEPFDFAVDEAPLEHLQKRAAALLGRALPPVARRWVGVYSAPLEEAVAYRKELAPGVLLVTGLGGRGMTLSPAVAETTLDEAGL